MPNTREKLIELCEDVILSCKSSLCDDCEHNCIDYPSCMGVHFADHLIANGVTLDNKIASNSKQVASSKWISVKDRLPDKNGEYLCRHTDKSVHSAEYESIYGSFGYWFDFWEDEYKEWIAYEGVTHWMPLPQPPKGE